MCFVVTCICVSYHQQASPHHSKPNHPNIFAKAGSGSSYFTTLVQLQNMRIGNPSFTMMHQPPQPSNDCIILPYGNSLADVRSAVHKLSKVHGDSAPALRVKCTEGAEAALEEQAHADVLIEAEHSIVVRVILLHHSLEDWGVQVEACSHNYDSISEPG